MTVLAHFTQSELPVTVALVLVGVVLGCLLATAAERFADRRRWRRRRRR